MILKTDASGNILREGQINFEATNLPMKSKIQKTVVIKTGVHDFNGPSGPEQIYPWNIINVIKQVKASAIHKSQIDFNVVKN